MGTLHDLSRGRETRTETASSPGANAEQAGAALASKLLGELARAETRGDAAALVQDAVLDLAELPRRDAAAAGFAVALADVLRRGLDKEDAE